MPNEGASRYGEKYYCIGLAGDDKTEVYAYADEVLFTENGGIFLSGRFRAGEDAEPSLTPTTTLAFAPGEWRYVYAASLLDGAAVAVEHWPGQIVE